MGKRKNIRERGKVSLSRYFQELQEGNHVALVHNQSFKASFPKSFHGSIGVISGKQGKTYAVKLLNGKKLKTLLVHPIHLKKIKK